MAELTDARTIRGRILRALVVLLAGAVAFYWNALAIRALVRFDRTGLDPGDVDRTCPVGYMETLRCCLGPVGWVVGLGAFGLALTMALAVRRWPWPVRVMLAVWPAAFVMYHIAFVWQLHPWVRPVCLEIASAGLGLAVLAAVLCGPISQLFLPESTGVTAPAQQPSCSSTEK